MPGVARIVSGGQSGVDRAALDWAIAHDLRYGGWCPAGGWAEDLTEPPGLLTRYEGLRATPSPEPSERTRRNVRDSDLTLIVSGAPSPGTERTVAAARELGRPVVVTDGGEGVVPAVAAALAVIGGRVVVNVAGPRASEWAKGYEVTWWVLDALRAGGLLAAHGHHGRRHGVVVHRRGRGAGDEKVIVATDQGDQGAVILVQGPEGDAQLLAREVMGSLDWR